MGLIDSIKYNKEHTHLIWRVGMTDQVFYIVVVIFAEPKLFKMELNGKQ